MELTPREKDKLLVFTAALLAERRLYGLNVVDSGPTPVTATRTGKTVTVAFDHVALGLAAYEYNGPIGFQLCDAEQRCMFATARIRGTDKVEVDGLLPGIETVRFCWADSPLCNLYNSEGLPAGTFEMAITGKKLTRTPRHRDFRATDGAH